MEISQIQLDFQKKLLILEDKVNAEILNVVKGTCYCRKKGVLEIQFGLTFQESSGFSHSGGSRFFCEDHAKIASKLFRQIEFLGHPVKELDDYAIKV